MIYDENYSGPTDPEERRAWKAATYILHYGSSVEQIHTYLGVKMPTPLDSAIREVQANLDKRNRRRAIKVAIAVVTVLTALLALVVWRLGTTP